MDPYEHIKEELDKHLARESPNVGIAFNIDLFDEFRTRGWFTLENFPIFGSMLFTEQLPAYKKTHFVFPSWGIQALEFKVGKSQ